MNESITYTQARITLVETLFLKKLAASLQGQQLTYTSATDSLIAVGASSVAPCDCVEGRESILVK